MGKEYDELKNGSLSDQIDEIVCPVCLHDDVDLVRTHCRHDVCLPCVKRLLAIPCSEDDSLLDIPTKGRCPMCREPICLFELERPNRKATTEHVKSEQDECVQHVILKNYNIAKTDLAGKIYIKNRSVIGDASFHFTLKDENTVPFIDMSKMKLEDCPEAKGSCSMKFKFDDDCHFHEETRSFHGRVDVIDPSLKVKTNWEICLVFSADYEFISRGIVVDTNSCKVRKIGPGHAREHFYLFRSSISSGTENSIGTVRYNKDSPWGNTFCQAWKVGLASYHFLDDIDQGVYISYEHEETSIWPPLDNGNPIPSQIWFTETTFDEASRTFCGKIDWYGKHGTTWQGCRWWNYTMIFDDSFTCVVGGMVKSVASDSDEELDMSKFGSELLYVNAGLVEQCQHTNSFSSLERAMGTIESLRLWAYLERSMRHHIGYPRSFFSNTTRDI